MSIIAIQIWDWWVPTAFAHEEAVVTVLSRPCGVLNPATYWLRLRAVPSRNKEGTRMFAEAKSTAENELWMKPKDENQGHNHIGNVIDPNT